MIFFNRKRTYKFSFSNKSLLKYDSFDKIKKREKVESIDRSVFGYEANQRRRLALL